MTTLTIFSLILNTLFLSKFVVSPCVSQYENNNKFYTWVSNYNVTNIYNLVAPNDDLIYICQNLNMNVGKLETQPGYSDFGECVSVDEDVCNVMVEYNYLMTTNIMKYYGFNVNSNILGGFWHDENDNLCPYFIGINKSPYQISKIMDRTQWNPPQRICYCDNIEVCQYGYGSPLSQDIDCPNYDDIRNPNIICANSKYSNKLSDCRYAHVVARPLNDDDNIKSYNIPCLTHTALEYVANDGSVLRSAVYGSKLQGVIPSGITLLCNEINGIFHNVTSSDLCGLESGLVGFIFDCDKVSSVEDRIRIKYDSCLNPNNREYSIPENDCHSYVEEIYDTYIKNE
jgi:hypothetical protein